MAAFPPERFACLYSRCKAQTAQVCSEMIMPGDNASLDIELITPIAMAEGLRFALREGGKTVGAGVVAKVIS